MSVESGTTTSSRLRQFGLYRTIDARTEEFLKLSRRRQIRQGCACAAVSTAITVTVVVTVLLVYEYAFHSNAQLTSRHRPRWLSMLNDSDASFDKHIQQTNFNLNTLKLLPILLKAIKQNQNLENVIEDSQTLADEEQTTDYPLERNIFTDSRNWIRMPTSRLYAIEYKSSPIMFFKTRNIDNFAKSAKIMNSQRIMSYIERMINEKVISYNKKIIQTTPSPKIASSDFRSKEQREEITQVRNSEITRSKEKAYCKCSNLGEAVKKLLNSIQQLNFLCSGGKFKTTTQKSTTLFTTRRTTSAKTVLTTDTAVEITKTNLLSNYRQQSRIPMKTESKFKFMPKSKSGNNIIQNMIANIRLIQNKVPQKDSMNDQNLDLQNMYASHARSSEDTTTTKSYIKPTERFDLKHITTTKPFPRRKVKHRVEDNEHFTFKRQGDLKDLADTLFSQKPTKAHIANYKSIPKNNAAVLKSQTNFQIEPLKSFSMDYEEIEYASESNFPYFSKSTTNLNNRNDTEMKTTTSPTKKFVTEISNIKNKHNIDLPEYLILEHQGTEQDSDTIYSPAPTTTINYNLYDEDQPKLRRNTALSQFLHKLEESKKNNLKFFDNSVSKLNGTTLKKNPQGSLFKSAGSTESLNTLNSLIPKSRTQFLEITRNDGKHERRDYDDDTHMNEFTYD